LDLGFAPASKTIEAQPESKGALLAEGHSHILTTGGEAGLNKSLLVAALLLRVLCGFFTAI
jgi:hypothetical protein